MHDLRRAPSLHTWLSGGLGRLLASHLCAVPLKLREVLIACGEEHRHHFETQSPLDSAGEFQLRIHWNLDPTRWVWAFDYGLKGTPTRSGARRWYLTREGKEPGISAGQIIRNS